MGITAPIPSAPGGPAPAETLTPRPSCVRCEYDLRGLAADAACPECGLPVEHSLAAAKDGSLLRYAPPGWVASLSWGAGLVLFSPILSYLYAAHLAPRLARVSLEAYFGGIASANLLFAAGVWLLTRPRPRAGGSGFAWRWALRLVSLVPVVQTAATYASMAPGMGARVRINPVIALVAFTPLPALLFLWLRRLALGLPNRRLAEHCLIVASLGTAYFAGASAGLFIGWTGSLDFIVGVAALLTMLWGMVLLAWCVIAFRRAHRASVAAWGGA